MDDDGLAPQKKSTDQKTSGRCIALPLPKGHRVFQSATETSASSYFAGRVGVIICVGAA
jgi:hypothetical protein